MKRTIRIGVWAGVVALCAAIAASAQAPARDQGQIRAADLKEWLGYIASDELEGRGAFTEGLALAASYVADNLKAWGVKPGGDHGSYFQRVAVLGVQNKGTASVTVEAGGQTRTFKLGEGIDLPKNLGGKQTITSDQIEFVGYGIRVPAAGIDDYKGRSVKGRVAVWIGGEGPKDFNLTKYRRVLFGRSRTATEQQGAIAVIGPLVVRPPFGGGAPGGGPGQPAQPPAAQAASPSAGQPAPPSAGQPAPAAAAQFLGQGVPAEIPDFTTVQKLDTLVPPVVSAKDEFFEFLFRGASVKYAELKEKASKREPLPAVSLSGVRLTFTLEPDYQVVRSQFTRNVVGIVEGTDPKLKQTYVAFGAHYDHVGYSQGEIVQGPSGSRRSAPAGRVKDGALDDRVWNGADDDGSGTVALMALARAFAQGPKPKRSLLFVWHCGEERGLWGSRYFADYPTVPLDAIVAELNADMIGRNRDDKADEANVVYLVGSDRISTELHQINEAADRAMASPLTLDYSFNDPADSESLYTRSDHYSYAVKGIPVVFYTTGLHPDYHANTDSVEKIQFDKMAHIVQLMHDTAMRVGNLDQAPARDNKGPRAVSRSK